MPREVNLIAGELNEKFYGKISGIYLLLQLREKAPWFLRMMFCVESVACLSAISE